MTDENRGLVCVEDVAEQCFHTGKASEIFLDPATGDIWKVSDQPRWRNPDMSVDQALELEENHRLLRLPKARDLQELDIMDEYIDYVPERTARDLSGILRQSVPFQAYRNRLEKEGLLEDYLDFRNERGGDIIADWCEDHEIAWRHQISVRKLSDILDARILTDKEAGQVSNLLRACGKPSSLRQVKTDLRWVPEGALFDNKFYVGYYDRSQRLVGILDLVLDFPADNQAYIRTLASDAGQDADGLLKGLEQELARAGFAHLETCVSDNEEFWKKNGYSLLRKEKGRLIFEKEQSLPDQEYVPEFDSEPGVWTF